jgi:hypothetical protein
MTARPIEQELLLSLARVPRAPQIDAYVDAETAARIDWQQILVLAARHGVLPLLDRNLPSFAPDGVAERLHAARTFNIGHALHLSAELLRILDALCVEGIRALPYKGPVLARQLYDDVAMRQFADLDLLVRPRDVSRARDVLLHLHYKGDALTPAQSGRLLRNNHCQMFTRGQDLAVELHWRITGLVHPTALDLERIWERTCTIKMAGRSIDVIAPEDLLPILCAHGAKHAWERLGWICDVAALVRKAAPADWTQLLQRARRGGYLRRLLWGLDLARVLLGAELPLDVHERLRRDPTVNALTRAASGRLFAAPVTKGRRNLLAYRAWEGWHGRASLITGGLFSVSPADWHTLPLPDRLHWLYPLFRPVRLLRTHFLRSAVQGRRP